MKTKLIFVAIVLVFAFVAIKTYHDTQISLNTTQTPTPSSTTTTGLNSAPFVTPTPSPTPDPALSILVASLGANQPKEWAGATLTTATLAPDLIEVDAKYEAKGPNEGKLEYWTNNRTGKWQLLGSFSYGQEGWGHCEDWEKLKVGKGMSCLRWNDAKGWVDSVVVNY